MLIYTLLLLCFHVCQVLHLQIHYPMHLAYKDNLLVQNWYYGTIDQMAYRLRVFEIAVNEVTNPCPMDAPFVNEQMNSCEQCPEERPLRNIGSYSCEPCPYGQQFSKVSGNCTVIIEKEPKQQEQMAIPEAMIPNNNQPKQNPINNQSQNASNKKQLQYFEPIVVMPSKSKDIEPQSEETNLEKANQSNLIQQSDNNNMTTTQDGNQMNDKSGIGEERKDTEQNYSNLTINEQGSKYEESGEEGVDRSAGDANNAEDGKPGSETIPLNIKTLNDSILDNEIINNKTRTLPQEKQSPKQQQQADNTHPKTIEPKSNQTTLENKTSNNTTLGFISQNQTNNTINGNFAYSQSTNNLTPSTAKTEQQVAGPVIDMDPKYVRDIYQQTIQQDHQQIPACSQQTPYWDRYSSTCIHCPQNTKYISLFSSCMHYAYLFNPNTEQIMEPEKDNIQTINQQVKQQYLNELIRQCPVGEPYVGVNSKGKMQCLQCNANQYYDLDQRQCRETCNQKQGLSYDKSLKMCIKKQTSQVKQYTPISEIKLHLYNLTGTQTNSCPSWIPVLDQKTNTCQQCPQYHQYQPSTQKCLPFLHIPNRDAGKLIMPTPSYFQKYEQFIKSTNPGRKVVECPIDKPHANGSECFRCPDTKQYYLLVNEECVEGCPFGTIYSENSKTCVNGKYLTNIDATRLYFKTQKRYISWISANANSKERHPDNKYCPLQTPFVQNGKCIDCKGEHPLYDIQMEKCTKCHNGTRYNKQSQLCQTNQSRIK